jgi:ethanolamine-phosphate cytidylyltransferase
MEDNSGRSSFSRLLLVLDLALSSRAIYGFLKAYFRWRLNRQKEATAALETASVAPRKKVRIYLDGCFDLMHYGHANAIRQAASLGDELIVGVCGDEEITRNKGPPVMTEEERYETVEAVKWVDQVIRGVPYNVTPEFLEMLVREYEIDYVVHGDDPCLDASGRDVYEAVKRAGKFRTIARTEGVSSTDIVGRMLLCTTSHHLPPSRSQSAEIDGPATERIPKEDQPVTSNGPAIEHQQRASSFLPTSRRLMQFSSGSMPRPGDRVVYADGAWDMLTAAHIRFLKQCRELGDFLLIGVHDDHVVNQHRGRNYPILNLHERTLMVLSIRYVDEVIIGAPWKVTEDMIKTMNISLVVHGTHYDALNVRDTDEDPYEVPKRFGIFREIPSSSDLSVPKIIERIVRNRERYLERQQRKSKQEATYYANKIHVEEL